MPSPGQRTTRSADARFSPQSVEPAAAPRPIVVVGEPDLAARIQQLLPRDTPDSSAEGQPSGVSSSTPVIRVGSFLSALGEAGCRDLAAVVGPVRSLSGMAGSTAESLRQLAPHARLILLRDADQTRDGSDSAADHEQDVRIALESGFDLALNPSPDLATLASALGLSAPHATPSDPRGPAAPPAREPVLRRADPTDLSTLDLSTPPSLAPAEVGSAADPSDRTAAPTYQATLDAALPRDFHRPPPASADNAQGHPPTHEHPDQALGDTDLVNVILRGHGQILPLALRMIRHQSGLAHVDFKPPQQPAPEQHAAVPVAHDDHHFGTLHAHAPAPGTTPGNTPAEVASAAAPSDRHHNTRAQLAVWADWLVHWLRLEAQFNRLRELAMKDELTGVWNRRYFNHFLKKILERAATDRQQVTLLVFDIDDFKLYNDAYGHAAGDEILRGVARLMLSSVREHDVVARIGGDEFAVIFWDAGEEPRKAHSKHPDDVLNAAKRFQQAVVDHRFPKLLDKAAGTLTISGGLAGFPWDGRTPEELLEAADTMAMQSKNQGKNAITFGPGARVDSDTPQPHDP